MLLNHRRALRDAGACLLAAAVLFALVAWTPGLAAIQDVDDAWLRLMRRLRTPVLVDVAKAFAFVGSAWVNWPLRGAAAVLLALKRRWLQLAAFALAVVTSEAFIGPMKALYARPRPPGGLLASSSFSFPSGHAIAGAVTAVALVIVLLPPGPRRWRWEVRAAVFAVLMAGSRTYLSVHWLSDVVAGGLLGAGLALGWPAVLQEVRDRRRAAGRARGADAPVSPAGGRGRRRGGRRRGRPPPVPPPGRRRRSGAARG